MSLWPGANHLNYQPRSFTMLSTYLGNGKIKRFIAYASTSLLVACAAIGGVGNAQTSAVPVLSVPDFTQVLAETEGSVVNIRTTAAVPMRHPAIGPNKIGNAHV